VIVTLVKTKFEFSQIPFPGQSSTSGATTISAHVVPDRVRVRVRARVRVRVRVMVRVRVWLRVRLG
jgi:hypothetical protein